MSPEQFEGLEADARSDQFSFCVALHEALFGARPFAGDSYDSLSESVRRGDRLEPRLLATPKVGTRMEDETRDPKRFAAFDLLEERVDRLLPKLGIHRREIDQVGVVNREFERTEFGVDLVEPAHRARVERLGPPLTAWLREDLRGAGAKSVGRFERVVESTRDRDMRAEERVPPLGFCVSFPPLEGGRGWGHDRPSASTDSSMNRRV